MRMIKTATLMSLAAFVVAISVTPGGGQEKKQEEKKQETPRPTRSESQPKTAPVTAAGPVYKPPLRGAPGGRVGGGTRGTGREVFVLSVLVPDHSGLTVREQPSLYWYISSPTSSPVELTVVDPGATEPTLETRIPGPIRAGVHRFRLADRGVRLSTGVPYRWFVAVVADAGRRSRDILAGGTIERVDPPEGLGARLAQAGKANLPFVYADAGLWYDALDALSELILAAPDDTSLRRQRAGLLAQVGLPEIGE